MYLKKALFELLIVLTILAGIVMLLAFYAFGSDTQLLICEHGPQIVKDTSSCIQLNQ